MTQMLCRLNIIVNLIEIPRIQCLVNIQISYLEADPVLRLVLLLRIEPILTR